MFVALHKPTGKLRQVFAVQGSWFLVYDWEDQQWLTIPMEEFEPVVET